MGWLVRGEAWNGLYFSYFLVSELEEFSQVSGNVGKKPALHDSFEQKP